MLQPLHGMNRAADPLGIVPANRKGRGGKAALAVAAETGFGESGSGQDDQVLEGGWQQRSEGHWLIQREDQMGFRI